MKFTRGVGGCLKDDALHTSQEGVGVCELVGGESGVDSSALLQSAASCVQTLPRSVSLAFGITRSGSCPHLLGTHWTGPQLRVAVPTQTPALWPCGHLMW